MRMHFVAYGSYDAPCGWSITKPGDNHSPDETTTEWAEIKCRIEINACPDCVLHGRRAGIIPWPEVPDLGDRPAIEAWLDS